MNIPYVNWIFYKDGSLIRTKKRFWTVFSMLHSCADFVEYTYIHDSVGWLTNCCVNRTAIEHRIPEGPSRHSFISVLFEIPSLIKWHKFFLEICNFFGSLFVPSIRTLQIGKKYTLRWNQRPQTHHQHSSSILQQLSVLFSAMLDDIQ